MTVRAVLLTHGAGSDRDHPTLTALEDGLAPLPVHRMNFPYREQGRRAPDRAPKLIAAIRDEVGEVCERLGIEPDDVVLGGRSMGGRMCSMAVAEGLPAAGLVLLSYPLHPPGKPDRLRTDHFPQLGVPCLFVTGTRDPFGTPDEVPHHIASIPGSTELHWLPGRHDVKGQDERIVELVAGWISSLDPAG